MSRSRLATRYREQSQDPITLSFVDVVCCGMGGTILLVIILFVLPHWGAFGLTVASRAVTGSDIVPAILTLDGIYGEVSVVVDGRNSDPLTMETSGDGRHHALIAGGVSRSIAMTIINGGLSVEDERTESSSLVRSPRFANLHCNIFERTCPSDYWRPLSALDSENESVWFIESTPDELSDQDMELTLVARILVCVEEISDSVLTGFSNGPGESGDHEITFQSCRPFHIPVPKEVTAAQLEHGLHIGAIMDGGILYNIGVLVGGSAGRYYLVRPAPDAPAKWFFEEVEEFGCLIPATNLRGNLYQSSKSCDLKRPSSSSNTSVLMVRIRAFDDACSASSCTTKVLRLYRGSSDPIELTFNLNEADAWQHEVSGIYFGVQLRGEHQ